MPESCSIEGCERIKWARSWCPLHYQRWRKHGDPLACRPRFWASTEPCSVDGCQRQGRKRGMCERHYQHWWIHGTPEVARYEACMIEGCDRPPRSARASLCEVHYYRIRRNGHTRLLDRHRARPSYGAAHSRIARARGRAREHDCVDCGEGAGHWSFAWRKVPSERWLWQMVRSTSLAYTGDPSDYEARCHRCARAYDRDFAKEGWRLTKREQMA